jgi:DNA-binding transcriptional ArsR family regulator
MSHILPQQPDVEPISREEKTVVVDCDQPTDVLQILSSDTAQEILSTLRAEPATASDIAASLDQTVQSVSYHLDRLSTADLITPVETWYSEKGKEMTVYALTADAVTVEFGGPSPESDSQPPELK